MRRPLYRSNVAEVTRLAELAMPHFAECRCRPGINAMIWGANASNAAAKLLARRAGGRDAPGHACVSWLRDLGAVFDESRSRSS